ncbi:hypothetical protein MMC20_001774 [Loxospora ochrophaea]|nr:hypothetical protein [Loxospora ochrophaea]
MGKALAAITPRRSTLSLASNVRLPPSPAVVADRIEQQTANLRSGAAEIWAKSGITEYSESLRDKLSSTLTIEMLALFVELWGLQGEVLPIRHLAMIPASRTLGTPEIPAKVPDLFALLTRSFWAPFLVWLTTSLALPVGFAYFFNLTLKSKHGRVAHARGATHPANQYDPLTFNVAKALVTWLVYNKGVSFGGLIGEESIEKVDANVPGGYQGVMIGAGIGVLSSFYEAVLKN